jgi:hypothetical protein
MSTTELHPLAAEYLDRLDDASRRLPRGSRRELLDEVEAHLLDTTSAAMSDAEVLTILDRLGDPEEIVEAQEPFQAPRQDAAGVREWSAIVLLLFGGFIFGVGWLIGVVLLWSSQVWRVRDKWIGTLVIPGGYAVVLFLGLALASSSGGACSASPGIVNGHIVGAAAAAVLCGSSSGPSALAIVIAVLVLLAPLAAAVHLGRRAVSARTA